MITRKSTPVRQADPAVQPDKALHHLQAELEALLHILPGTGLRLSSPGQPDEETVEAGFDNMPV